MTNKAALFALGLGTRGCRCSLPRRWIVCWHDGCLCRCAHDTCGFVRFPQCCPGPAVCRPTTASASRRASNAADTIKLSPSSATSVVAWYHGNGGAAFTSLTKALDQASSAKATGALQPSRRTADKSERQPRRQKPSPPMPVSSAAQSSTTALKGYVQSAADCQQGVSTQDEKLIQQAAGEVETNNSYLNRAAAVLIAALSAGK